MDISSRFGLLLLAGGLAAAGCSSARAKRDAASVPGNGAAKTPGSAGTPVLPPGADVEEASLRYKDYIPSRDLAAIRFDYDQAALSEEARAALKRNAEWLTANPLVEIRVAGHCDDRGTVPYNLALGQKRANAVRDFYRMLGVPNGRMATISYGKESPACPETTEDCRGLNRRADSFVRRGNAVASRSR
ncbi:MAG: OmpA family protein [Elusimicrobia bacterium]|nr:OmpA family protein [Elusimicrobiota bacterium]